MPLLISGIATLRGGELIKKTKFLMKKHAAADENF
jgi:hypothetical protein